MEVHHFEIFRIEGEYAVLKNTESGDEVFIALALLPQGCDVGTKLREEMFQYTIE